MITCPHCSARIDRAEAFWCIWCRRFVCGHDSVPVQYETHQSEDLHECVECSWTLDDFRPLLVWGIEEKMGDAN